MANLMETWRKFIEIPERTEQHARTERKTVSNARIISNAQEVENTEKNTVGKAGASNPADYIQKQIDKAGLEKEANLEKTKKIDTLEKDKKQNVMKQQKEEIAVLQKELEGLKKQNEEGNRRLEEISRVLEDFAEKSSTVKLEEIKLIVENAVKEQNNSETLMDIIQEKFALSEAQIDSLQSTRKDELILKSLQDMSEQTSQFESELQKLGSIKIMVGVSIWCSLLMFAVLVAHVLQFI